ncbi:MAG: magnesium chelatase domain-containing protein, partial [Nitrospinota bacterium]
MLAKTQAAAVLGVDAHPVEVEVDLASGLPYYSTVGLPDAAVKESKDRIRAAISNTGFIYPLGRITVSLSPADMRKEGSAFDLPIALGLLRANGALNGGGERTRGMMFLGELALDGALKPVRGALNVAVLAKKLGVEGLVLPAENAGEAAVVGGLPV